MSPVTSGFGQVLLNRRNIVTRENAAAYQFTDTETVCFLFLREWNVSNRVSERVVATFMSIPEQARCRRHPSQDVRIVEDNRRPIPCPRREGYVLQVVLDDGCHGKTAKVTASIVCNLP
ncbi:MAG TPA: hypothetical protein VNA04_09335, partial [Thermoanaerobaculia bacterium]|nr:hypothetical protein [Thermoanaerobaculia bacterium]